MVIHISDILSPFYHHPSLILVLPARTGSRYWKVLGKCLINIVSNSIVKVPSKSLIIARKSHEMIKDIEHREDSCTHAATGKNPASTSISY